MASAGRKERKVVTVVFADLVGFTARAESLDPEDVHAFLDFYSSVGAAAYVRRGETLLAVSA